MSNPNSMQSSVQNCECARMQAGQVDVDWRGTLNTSNCSVDAFPLPKKDVYLLALCLDLQRVLL